jgi:hypothetical protein
MAGDHRDLAILGAIRRAEKAEAEVERLKFLLTAIDFTSGEETRRAEGLRAEVERLRSACDVYKATSAEWEAEAARLRAAILAWLGSLSTESLAAMRDLAERDTTSAPVKP